jgi:hypothetical protein
LAICFIAVFAVRFAPPAYAASMEFLNTFYAAIGRTFIAVTPPTDGLIVEGRVGLGEPYPTAMLHASQQSFPGTVSNIASGTTVAGTSTKFTKDLKLGDWILVSGATPTQVTVITSDTLITVSPAITALHSAVAYTIYTPAEGTVTYIASGTTLAGSGTRFTEFLRAGDVIYVAGVTSVTLTSVDTDILLTVPAMSGAKSGVTIVYPNRTILRAQGNGVMQFDELKMLTFRNDSLADDGTIILPDAVDGYGFVKSGVSCTWFTTTAAGAVVVTGGTGGVAAADSDSNLCVFDSGTTVTIRNRAGSAQVVKGTYWYR